MVSRPACGTSLRLTASSTIRRPPTNDGETVPGCRRGVRADPDAAGPFVSPDDRAVLGDEAASGACARRCDQVEAGGLSGTNWFARRNGVDRK
jgi:hypothetical protein